MRKGSKNGNALLADAEVAEIRRLYKEDGVKQKDLAKRYRVSQQSISLITTLKRWKDDLYNSKDDNNSKQMKSEDLYNSKTDNNSKNLSDMWGFPMAVKEIRHNVSTKQPNKSPWDLIKLAEDEELGLDGVIDLTKNV